MVLANMTFEIWRKARSKVRGGEGGGSVLGSWKKGGGIEHGGEGVETEREKRMWRKLSSASSH